MRANRLIFTPGCDKVSHFKCAILSQQGIFCDTIFDKSGALYYII